MSSRYPTKAEISRVVEAAKACGVQVGGVEVAPDGSIKITAPNAGNCAPLESDFDKWNRAGLL